MKTKLIVPVFAIAAFLFCQVGSAQPEPETLLPSFEIQPGGKDKTQPPDKKKQPEEKKIAPETDIFTQAPTMSSEFPTGFNPQMLGDFGVFFAKQTFTFTGTQTITKTTNVFVGGPNGTPKSLVRSTTTTTTQPVTQTQTITVPYASSAAAFKIAENESPRPTDRVFFVWNYFGALRGPDNGPATQSVSNVQTTIPGPRGLQTTVATAVITDFPAPPRATANLHREIFGFEKTFLNGFASIELRVPFVQMTGNIEGIGAQNIGDMTIIGKYAFLLDNTTGNVISGGLAITAPTGPGIQTIDGNLHSTLLQPWFGYIFNADTFFLHAFHSIVVPTDVRDVTLFFNDVGINYWLYRAAPDRALNYIVPMIEAHLTTPLNHRNQEGVIFVPDALVMTAGVHLGILRNGNVSIGVATPVTGPRVFNIETFVQLNWRY